MKIAVVTTDARMNVVYQILKRDYEVIKLQNPKDFYDDVDKLDVLVLPVKGITKEGFLQLKERTISIPSSFWKRLSVTCRICCGMRQDFLKQLPNECHYYMQDEEVLKKNAILTAQGILFLLLDNASKGLQQLHVDIIGYGRCGKAVYEYLSALQVPCRMIRREIGDCESAINIQTWKALEPGDFIINTSIQTVIDTTLMDRWKKKPCIIDIATPDVIDQKYAMKKGIRFIKAGNLPAIFAYETAGHFIADYVKGVIENGK